MLYSLTIEFSSGLFTYVSVLCDYLIAALNFEHIILLVDHRGDNSKENM